MAASNLETISVVSGSINQPLQTSSGERQSRFAILLCYDDVALTCVYNFMRQVQFDQYIRQQNVVAMMINKS